MFKVDSAGIRRQLKWSRRSARAHTHSRTHTHSHTRTHAHTHAHSLSHTRAHTHSRTRTHTLSHAHAHTRTHTLAHTHTRTHTLTSVPALLTWQWSWYFIKIKYSEPNISAAASVSPLAFAVLLLAVKQRCIAAGAPFWIGGELPVFVVRPHALNRDACTVTVRYKYMYRATPTLHTKLNYFNSWNSRFGKRLARVGNSDKLSDTGRGLNLRPVQGSTPLRSLAPEAVLKDQTLPLLSCSSVWNRSHCCSRSFCPSVSAPQASWARRLAVRAFWCSPR